MSKVKEFRVGLSTCFDVRFPRMYQDYKNKKADILCIPSAFTRETGLAHWEVLLRARAIEGLCYVLAPNQVGCDGQGILRYGHSMIIDPWGKILARASDRQEDIIYADLHKKNIIEKRRILFSVMTKDS